jgi:excinuclease ABC subunit C
MNDQVSAHYDLDPQRLRQLLPEAPGVYLFKDGSGRVLYVGKAKNLRKRVLSYFKPATDLPSKTDWMMKRALGLDHIITSNEKEAFILESNLVKKLMPRYNIVLRDDKEYPSLRMDLKADYPCLNIARRIKKDGARYFGPFDSANAVRSTLKLIERVFQLRKCRGPSPPARKRPCLNCQMERCLGPCAQEIPPSKYRAVVDQVILFLEGRDSELIDHLREEMLDASDRLDFERAARIRDQIAAVERTIERQHVVSLRMADHDVIGMTRGDHHCQMVLLLIRKGRLMGSRDYLLKDQGASAGEVMEAFLKQYYGRESFIPDEVLISEGADDLEAITDWISDLAGKRVIIRRALRGEKRRLVEMAVTNARNLLKNRRQWEDRDLMERVGTALSLHQTPRTIEGLDISNFQGDMAVGTVVSFVDGAPHRAGYKNFRIRTIETIDDYGMMAELVTRRLAKGDLPDLFLVDGGKGHLAAVKRVLEGAKEAGATDVVSIAKPDAARQERHDKIFVPGRKNPLSLKGDDPVLLLMMRIRDEAHRRAISYHRGLSGKRMQASDLDGIPGVGRKRRAILLKHFRDMEAISEAGLEDLLSVKGITRPVALSIVNFFRTRGNGTDS